MDWMKPVQISTKDKSCFGPVTDPLATWSFIKNNWVFSKGFSLNSATNNNLKDSIDWPLVYQASIFEWFLRVQWTQWKFVSISGQLWVTNNTNQCIRVHLHQTSKSTLAILSFENNSILENGLQLPSGVTPLFSMRTASLASSQSCRSVGTDSTCK